MLDKLYENILSAADVNFKKLKRKFIYVKIIIEIL